MNKHIRKVNHNVFDVYSPENCYWAGFIAADGNIRKDVPYISIQLKGSDEGHLKKFLFFIKSDRHITRQTKIQKSGRVTEVCGIHIYSHQIKSSLKEKFNIVPAKTKVLEPPLKIPKALVKHYIRGCFDGDGSVCWHKHNNRPRLQFASGSYKLIKWIKNTIESNVCVGSPKIEQNKKWKTYSVNYMGKQSLMILDWLYKPNQCKLNRKFQLYLNYKYELALIEEKLETIKLNRINRNRKIINFRNMGLSFSKIANKVNVSVSTCYNVIKGMECDIS